MKEEHRLKSIFKNTVLRKILGTNMDEVTGNRSRLHSEELHDQHYLPQHEEMDGARNMWERCVRGFW